MLNFDVSLLLYAVLTVCLEMPVFYWFGYKKRQELVTFGGANIMSNLLLNETLRDCAWTGNYWLVLFIGETMVVALEFWLLTYAVAINRRRLFKVIVLTNVFSFLAGLIIFT